MGPEYMSLHCVVRRPMCRRARFASRRSRGVRSARTVALSPLGFAGSGRAGRGQQQHCAGCGPDACADQFSTPSCCVAPPRTLRRMPPGGQAPRASAWSSMWGGATVVQRCGFPVEWIGRSRELGHLGRVHPSQVRGRIVSPGCVCSPLAALTSSSASASFFRRHADGRQRTTAASLRQRRLRQVRRARLRDATAQRRGVLKFREEEGSYLVGAVAGLATRSHVVGFVGGMDIPSSTSLKTVTAREFLAVCPDCRVLVGYAGTSGDAFKNPTRGKELALAQYAASAEVIFHAAGSTDLFFEARSRARRTSHRCGCRPVG